MKRVQRIYEAATYQKEAERDLEEAELMEDDNRYLRREARRLVGDTIIGANFGLKEVTGMASRVAGLDSTVLLLGETGTGKDVFANAIHHLSPRKDGPFVKVNCGAIPDTLLDSELFGHEKGAFTGAVKRNKGCFERAQGGTIFLDEIGELPPQAQVRLLRVLQDKNIQRVGGDNSIPVDVRVVAATNRDLEQMVTEGTFREDLWFRLNVFPIQLPPLRDRPLDIPALARHFVESKAQDLKLPRIPQIDPNAMEALANYEWPGNVRELANIVERELILNPDGPLDFKRIGPAFSRQITNANASMSETTSPTKQDRVIDNTSYNLDDAIATQIQKALNKANGQIHGKDGAAVLLGVNPSTLRSRMKKLGMSA